MSKDMFKNPERISHTPWARIKRVMPGQIVGKHSFETPINEKTQVVLEGVMAARGGKGGANISGTIKHQFSPRFWGQYTQALLAPRIGSFKATYQIDENTSVNRCGQFADVVGMSPETPSYRRWKVLRACRCRLEESCTRSRPDSSRTTRVSGSSGRGARTWTPG